MEGETYHTPALLTETMDALCIDKCGSYVDATFGGGGHSRAILERLGPNGRLYGFDRDIDALRNAPDDSRFTFVHSDYRFIPNFLTYYGILPTPNHYDPQNFPGVNGILADLGVSFHHFDDASRGFSFREDAPLDMRMNRSGEKTAADIINNSTEKELEEIFRTFTDLKRPGAIAKSLEKAKADSPITTTGRLTNVLTPLMNPKSLKKDLSQAFQAIRIAVNDEMESLKFLLTNSLQVLRPGGRLAVITYHSIEDRIVKNFMRAGNFRGEVERDFYGVAVTPWRSITRSPIIPTEREIETNPRSRSAKLRVAELIIKPD